jgi:hypothetical protein
MTEKDNLWAGLSTGILLFCSFFYETAVRKLKTLRQKIHVEIVHYDTITN